MIAVDTNILVYAFNAEATEHTAAAAVMTDLVGRPAWGLPWIAAAEFLAVVTSPRLWEDPDRSRAREALDEWLRSPGVAPLGETPDLWPRLRSLLAASGARGRQVHDARIAAVCLAHGVTELWTLDRDFSWYPELRTRNPLAG